MIKKSITKIHEKYKQKIYELSLYQGLNLKQSTYNNIIIFIIYILY